MDKTKTVKARVKKTTPKRQECEVFSRIVGYLRPVNAWNPGKQAEFGDRKEFRVQ